MDTVYHSFGYDISEFGHDIPEFACDVSDFQIRYIRVLDTIYWIFGQNLQHSMRGVNVPRRLRSAEQSVPYRVSPPHNRRKTPRNFFVRRHETLRGCLPVVPGMFVTGNGNTKVHGLAGAHHNKSGSLFPSDEKKTGKTNRTVFLKASDEYRRKIKF